MRISDWSSDVCSSDLDRRGGDNRRWISGDVRCGKRCPGRRAGDSEGAIRLGSEIPRQDECEEESEIEIYVRHYRYFGQGRCGGAAGRWADRTGVVVGKRVSVGFDFGGRGNIKKKQACTYM